MSFCFNTRAREGHGEKRIENKGYRPFTYVIRVQN
jgi:hypothetical protein